MGRRHKQLEMRVTFLHDEPKLRAICRAKCRLLLYWTTVAGMTDHMAVHVAGAKVLS